jgi:hypothetical protein
MDVQEKFFKLFSGADIVEDPLAADGKAARMDSASLGWEIPGAPGRKIRRRWFLAHPRLVAL